MWDYLEKSSLPAMLNELPHPYRFRAWCAGCSTGEEAYSLAIVLTDVLEQLSEKKDLRIAEMKVLRAHFYFELMKNFGSFAYIDENTPIDKVASVENSFDTAFLWGKIEKDLTKDVNE